MLIESKTWLSIGGSLRELLHLRAIIPLGLPVVFVPATIQFLVLNPADILAAIWSVLLAISYALGSGIV